MAVEATVNVHDELYGTVPLSTSTDALLLALIASRAFQRLGGVLQHGISAVSVANVCGTTRVRRSSHSLGAMLLVRRLGASVEEQAAALLHDSAHTSLSHTIDNALGFVVHEEMKMEYVRTTDLEAIIATHGYDPDRVLDETNFSLLEQPSPLLCGDRLDYALRDSVAFGHLTLEDVAMILGDLSTHNGEIICKSVKSARLVSDAYIKSDQFAWSNQTNAVLYELASEAIREAFRLRQLDLADLWRHASCDDFWDSLVTSPHDSVRRMASRVRADIVVEEVDDSAALVSSDGMMLRLKLKPRTLDPHVLIGSHSSLEGIQGVKRLSELDSAYAAQVAQYWASKADEKLLRIRWGPRDRAEPC